MVSVLASSTVYCGFKPWSRQTTDCKIDFSWSSAKHAVLRRKNEDWLAQNLDNVSEWSDMSIGIVCCFSELAPKNPNKQKLIGLLHSRHHPLTEYTLVSPLCSWKIAHLVFNNNHSLKHLKGGCLSCNHIVFEFFWHLRMQLSYYHYKDCEFDFVKTCFIC